jgi:plasmid maintenance system killer protein
MRGDPFKPHRFSAGCHPFGCALVWVNGNWRVTFRFIETGAELVDYQDYH